jgi:hypothetical protein
MHPSNHDWGEVSAHRAHDRSADIFNHLAKKRSSHKIEKQTEIDFESFW